MCFVIRYLLDTAKNSQTKLVSINQRPILFLKTSINNSVTKTTTFIVAKREISEIIVALKK